VSARLTGDELAAAIREEARELGYGSVSAYLNAPGRITALEGDGQPATVLRVVELVSGRDVVGRVVLTVDPDVEPVHLAATVAAALTYRVGEQEITRHDIEEWWA
jgi:hypothetical protein